MRRLLVCNVTWMKNYQGPEEYVSSNFRYIREKNVGHELLNFKEINGYYCGFAETRGYKLDLSRIEKGFSGDQIDNVTVVFISHKKNDATYVVGFYTNATVYREIQKDRCIEEYSDYIVRTTSRNAYLIPEGERSYKLKSGKGNRPGRFCVWYCDNAEVRQSLFNYVDECVESKKFDDNLRHYIDDDDRYSIVSSDDNDKGEDNNSNKEPKRNLIKNFVYERNPNISQKALKDAEYKCQLNDDFSFVNRHKRMYVEAHHLIPMNAQDDFKNISLDDVRNIVSLCPNCHRFLHFGLNIENELKKLYDLKYNDLRSMGIVISFDELLKYYK